MIEILVNITIGSVAGVFTFLCCIIIWKKDLKKNFPGTTGFNKKRNDALAQKEPSSLPSESPFRLSINVKHQELSLAKEGTTAVGSYLNIQRSIDGIQSTHRVFLN